MTKKNFIMMTTCAAVFGMVGGMTFEGVNTLTSGNSSAVESTQKTSDSTKKKVAATLTSANTSGSTSSDGVSTVAENVLPSIVAINVKAKTTQTDMFGRTYEQDSSGSGSGIIVAQDDEYMYIATNNHVVDGAESVSVTFNDEKVCSATVKGTDSDSDLAVVSVALKDISDSTLNNVKVATLGKSADVKVGAQAIAIGNALGYGTSVTVGYISAKDREVSSEDVTMKLLQTDAAINPGNSGGALINAAKYSSSSVEGMGFAIPIDKAKPIINEIIKSEKVSEDEAAYLGIRGTDVTEEYAQYYNMPQGICVTDVTDGSPASDAGIKKGDVIVSFNGKDVSTMEGLQEKMSLCKAGDSVEVVVKRADNGEYVSRTLKVTLGKAEK